MNIWRNLADQTISKTQSSNCFKLNIFFLLKWYLLKSTKWKGQKATYFHILSKLFLFVFIAVCPDQSVEVIVIICLQLGDEFGVSFPLKFPPPLSLSLKFKYSLFEIKEKVSSNWNNLFPDIVKKVIACYSLFLFLKQFFRLLIYQTYFLVKRQLGTFDQLFKFY
jgi:hypothetical protein